MNVLRYLGCCLIGVMFAEQCLADNLPSELLTSSTYSQTSYAFADAGNWIGGWSFDYGPTSSWEATGYNDANNGSIADVLSMHSGDIGDSALIPSVSVAALMMAQTLGGSAAATGGADAGGTYEILPDPLNSSVTCGWLKARLNVECFAFPGSTTYGDASIQYPMGDIRLESSISSDGTRSTQVYANGALVENSQNAFSIQVETLVYVGDIVTLSAGQDGGGGVESAGMDSTLLDTSAGASYSVNGVLPSNPNVTRIRKLIWNEVTEMYDVGDVIWEYEPGGYWWY